MANYWTGAHWLDGPMLVEWLEKMFGDDSNIHPRASLTVALSRELGSGFQRRLHDWRTGGIAEIYTVDRYLIALGHHPGEIPDHIWLEDTQGRYGFGSRRMAVAA